MQDLDIIIPVYNESGNIAELSQRIHSSLSKENIKYRTIFVDDHSSDNTIEEIKKASKEYPTELLLKQGKKGKAYSILEGSRVAKSEYIAMIDGDLQYPPEALPEMFKLISKYGMVVANRRKNDTQVLRKIGSKVNIFIFEKLLHGFKVDTQSGLKIFKKEIIEHLNEKDVSGWTIDMPLLKIALELGYNIGSIDINFDKRRNGKSNVNFLSTAREIAVSAIKLKLARKKVYPIKSQSENFPLGAGFAHKGVRFLTHSNLSYEKSALHTFYPWQKRTIFLTLAILSSGLIIDAKSTLIILIAILTFIYFLDFIFSLFVLLKSLHFPPEIKVEDSEIQKLDEKNLPIYTILCPLYKEEKILPSFINSIETLDWPKDKLDVLLLLEEDDKKTQETAYSLNLPTHFRIITVPHSLPKTKPKACNYGLHHAKGEYIVIYDAEDRPEPLQLKKAYLAFKRYNGKLFCLQGKLNYYNPKQNLLTRLFTAEYSLWFDVILPGLQSIEATIPLGGTSNHFRTEDLKKIHGWDPFNVTEDCDLGVRLFKAGYKTGILDSMTYEEANSRVNNWIRQRSRWIKGYLQTYLVHTRHPIHFLKKHGIQALVFQLVIGTRMTFMLINPFLWSATILYFIAYKFVGPAIDALYPVPIFYMAVVSLVFGNFMYLYNYMIGCAKRKNWSLIKYVFLAPIYWILASIAAVVASHQLIFKPHYWEKTHHGFHLAKEEEEKLKKAQKIIAERERKKRFISIRNWAGNGAFGAVALILSSILANFSNFIYNAYLGRNLNLVEFGIVGLLSNIFAISNIAVGAVARSVTYKTAYLLGKLDHPTKEFWTHNFKWAAVVSIFTTAIWILLLPFLISYFNIDSFLPLMLFTPILSVGLLGSINTGFLSGNLKFLQIGLIAVIETLVKLGSALILVELGLTDFVYAAIPVSILVSFILSSIFVLRIGGGQKNVVVESVKTFPKGFFVSSILTGISTVSFLSLDVVLAKHFLVPVEAGRYALLSLAGKMIYFLGSIFSQFIVPVISKREGANKDSSVTFYKILTATAFSSFIAWIGVGLLGEFSIPILLGERAKDITYLLPIYGMALAQLSVTTAIISYNQIKKRYIFPVVGLLFSFLEVWAITSRHSNVSEIAIVVSILSITQLFAVGSLHLVYGTLEIFARNLVDFFKIFSPISTNGQRSQSRLKILIFNWRDTKHVYAGGAETYVHEIAKRWVREGHSITLFCGNDGKSRRNEVVDSVRIVRRGGFYTVYLWAMLYYLIQFRGKFDLVIDCENGIPFFTPFYVKIPKILLIHHVHQNVFRQHLSFPLSSFAIFAELKLIPLFYKKTGIVTVSDSSKKDIVNLGWARKESVEVVNPGVNNPTFKEIKKTKYPSFVYLGRLKHYKNVDCAIGAFANIVKKYETAQFIIAGKGEEEEYLRVLVKKQGLETSVKLLGFVDERQKYKLLASSWASIQPSSFEGWGITVIEANIVGTPVIASKINGLIDSVVDGKTGLLVPIRDEKVLSKAMEGIITDRKFRKDLSKKAYEWAKLFSWDKTAREFMRVILRRLEPSAEVVFTQSTHVDYPIG